MSKTSVTYKNEQHASAGYRHFLENGISSSFDVPGTLIVDDEAPGFWACKREQGRCGWLLT